MAVCNHIHDTTTRYDAERKVLTFLLFCPVCRTGRVFQECLYEPRFTPSERRS